MDLNSKNENESKVKNNLTVNDISQYELGEKLGEGTFGKVKIAKHKLTNEYVAIKILDKNKIKKRSDLTRINKEINSLKKVIHNNIVRLYSIIENNLNIYIVQEYISGIELYQYIKNNKKLSEVESCILYQQIISGIEYIHSMGIAHRDLKPENIILSNSKTVKIIDFGLSTIYSKDQLLITKCGSPCYAPPEMMIEGEEYHGLPVDIWSSGIILFFMLTGNLPYYESTDEELFHTIINGKYDIPNSVSSEAKDLIKKILEPNPASRIKINEIKEHPWFNIINKIFNIHDGINYNKTVIPIDEDIIQEMHNMGFNKMQVRDNIIRNLHNNITTTYYLLLLKKNKKGKESIADLFSYSFEKYLDDKSNNFANYNFNLDEVLKNRISSKGKLDTLPIFENNEVNEIIITDINLRNSSPRKKKDINKMKKIDYNKIDISNQSKQITTKREISSPLKLFSKLIKIKNKNPKNNQKIKKYNSIELNLNTNVKNTIIEKGNEKRLNISTIHRFGQKNLNFSFIGEHSPKKIISNNNSIRKKSNYNHNNTIYKKINFHSIINDRSCKKNKELKSSKLYILKYIKSNRILEQKRKKFIRHEVSSNKNKTLINELSCSKDRINHITNYSHCINNINTLDTIKDNKIESPKNTNMKLMSIDKKEKLKIKQIKFQILEEETYTPCDLSMIFLNKKNKVFDELENYYTKNKMKIRKVRDKYLFIKNNSVLFEISIDKSKDNLNHFIRIKMIEGNIITNANLFKLLYKFLNQ